MTDGYASTGGAFKNPLSRLRTKQYVEPGDPAKITEVRAAKELFE